MTRVEPEDEHQVEEELAEEDGARRRQQLERQRRAPLLFHHERARKPRHGARRRSPPRASPRAPRRAPLAPEGKQDDGDRRDDEHQQRADRVARPELRAPVLEEDRHGRPNGTESSRGHFSGCIQVHLPVEAVDIGQVVRGHNQDPSRPLLLHDRRTIRDPFLVEIRHRLVEDRSGGRWRSAKAYFTRCFMPEEYVRTDRPCGDRATRPRSSSAASASKSSPGSPCELRSSPSR